MGSSACIRAVMFDLGGTLETVYYDDDLRLKATPGFRDILVKYDMDPGLENTDLYAVLKSGMEKYRVWREANEYEIPPERIWSEFVFTDCALPREKLAAIGEELAFYWDTHFSKRTLVPEVPAMLNALQAQGIRLGVISNITSRGMVPYNLTQDGIASYFDIVLASSVFGWRKPNPRIFYQAAQLLNVLPAECAYVGDTVSRDVIGAHRAGYAMAIQIKSFLTQKVDQVPSPEQPDAIIENLMQVVDLVRSYPSLKKSHT